MAEKAKETAIIIDQKELLPGICDMWLRTEKIAKEAKAGQFVSVYCHDGSRILPRPISICEIDKEDGAIRLVYRVAGKGTEEFSKMRTGMHLQLVGPLGNGFPKKEKKAFLIGGGIGIPPMLELAKELNCEKQIVLGFRDEMFLMDDLKKQGSVYVATEDGSAGTEGNVLDAIRENGLDADIIYACGPLPMLRAIKDIRGRKTASSAGSPWKNAWRAALEPVLPVYANRKSADEHSNVTEQENMQRRPGIPMRRR